MNKLAFPFDTFRLCIILTCLGWFGNTAANWHPDPDGDGISSANDRCPNIFDPQQGDQDGDGIGNYCDADYSPPVKDGPVTDLRIEHITPYGAWLTLTSPYDAEYGWPATVAWSTNQNELKDINGFKDAKNRGDSFSLNQRIHAGFKERVREPIILTQLEPNTTYYVAITRGSGNDLETTISNIAKFTTTSVALPQPPTAHPHVYATPSFIKVLKNRRASNDSGWAKWEDKTRARAQNAASGNDDEDRQYCFDAALLYLVTGSTQDRDTALSLLDTSISFWENAKLDGNQYRWENAQLGACLDLLWDTVSASKRNRAIRAFLQDDETHIANGLRFQDTDEFASSIRNWIVDGLVACGASGIDSALSDRACAVLDAGHRHWHGVQLVKARRSNGKYAQSGGFKPDGTSYGHGTQVYWLESFLALANAGESASIYGEHIENSLLSMFIHLFTPTQKGFAPLGDIEAYKDNFDKEPNSYQLKRADGGILGLFSGVLDKAGRRKAAGWAQFLANKRFDVDPLNKTSETTKYRLLFETDSLSKEDYTSDLDTYFHADGFGVIFDRTSWDENASYLVFRAGWNAIDHVHADSGHFQLFRRGKWLTHESIAYDGLAACLGHNIWVMKTGDDGNGACPRSEGQNYYTDSDHSKSLVLKSSSGASYTYVASELAGAYNTFDENIRYFDSIQRSLFWAKDVGEDGVDTLVILDRIRTTANAPTNAIKHFQIHMDNAPDIDGQHAYAIMDGQQLVVDVVSPSSASLSSVGPTGKAGGNNHAIYTHRLLVEPGVGNGSIDVLTVLRGANAGPTLSTPIAVNSSTLQGVFVQGSLVLMPTAPINEHGSSLNAATVKLSTTSSLNLFITGLAPETRYALSATQNGSELTISLAPNGNIETDKGGVLGVSIDSNRKISPIETTSTLFKSSFETNS